MRHCAKHIKTSHHVEELSTGPIMVNNHPVGFFFDNHDCAHVSTMLHTVLAQLGHPDEMVKKHQDNPTLLMAYSFLKGFHKKLSVEVLTPIQPLSTAGVGDESGVSGG